MRQLLAATILLALMAAPALYFLRDTPEVRAVTHAVGTGLEGAAETDATSAIVGGMHRVAAGLEGAAETDATSEIVEGLHRVAAGLAASLTDAGQSTGALSVATIRVEPAREVLVAIGKPTGRGEAATTGSIKLAVGKDHDLRTGPADSSDPDQDVAATGPDGHGLPGYRNRGSVFTAGPGPWRTPIDLAGMHNGHRLSRDYPTSFTWFDLV